MPLLGRNEWLATRADLPATPLAGCKYFIEDEGVILLDAGNGMKEYGGEGGILDAPTDGKTYGRKDAGWVEGTGGGGVADIGDIKANLGTTPPDGWLECDGATLLRADYPDLANHLFNTNLTLYEVPDGVSFRLPDLRGEFLRGWDHGRGIDPTAGRAIGSAEEDALQNITGGVGDISSFTTLTTNMGEQSGNSAIYHTSVVSVNPHRVTLGNYGAYFSIAFDASRAARTSTETRPRNVAVMYCIKY